MARELERTLGAPVFERGATGIRLSSFGLAILSQVQRSLAHLDQLAEDLPSHREGAGTALRIGSPSFTAAALLARPVAQWLVSGFMNLREHREAAGAPSARRKPQP